MAAPRKLRRIPSKKKAIEPSDSPAARPRAAPEDLISEIVAQIRSLASAEAPGLGLSAKDAAELLEVAKQLRQRISTLRVATVGMLQKVADTPEPGDEGASSYVEMKVQLLLSYLVGLNYYLVLKLRGASVRDHPVVPKLLWIRTLLEKLKPVDQRLQYQINKLLQLSDAKAVDESSPSAPDPLSLKPGLLATTVEDDSGPEDGEAGKAPTDGVYRPPKIAQVEYTGDHIGMQERAERDFERKKSRLERSEFVRSLREEFTDAPAEIQSEQRSAKAERAARLLLEQREYEENNMVRLRVAKAEGKTQRRMLRMGRLSSGGAVPLDEAVADFHELSRMSADSGTRGGKGRGRGRGSGSVLQEYHEAARRVNDTRSVVENALSGSHGQKRRAPAAKGGGKRHRR